MAKEPVFYDKPDRFRSDQSQNVTTLSEIHPFDLCPSVASPPAIHPWYPNRRQARKNPEQIGSLRVKREYIKYPFMYTKIKTN